MPNEIKDFKDLSGYLEEKLETMKGNFSKAREDDKTGFEAKVKSAMNDLKKEHEEKIAELRKSIENEIDKNLQEMKKKQAEGQKALSFSQAMKKSINEMGDDLKALAGAKNKAGILELKAFDYSDFTGYEEFTTQYSQNPITNKYSRFHYRNILPPGRMNGEFVSYPREGATTGSASVWEVGSGAKPEIQPSLAPYTVQAKWIAGLMKEIPVSMLEDFAWMGTFLSNKGEKEILKAEDLFIQNGTASIDGLLDAAVAYDGSKTVFIEKLIDAGYRQLANAENDVNGYVLSNGDYTDILLNAASGSGEYDLPSIVGVRPDGTLVIANQPVFANSYLATGQAMIGDWTEAQFLIRSAPRLRIFEQNADNAENNVVLVRIEERVALAIYRDNAFVRIGNAS